MVAGIAISAILGGWFGALQGNYWLNVLAITLSIGAISATLVGLRGMFGSPGLAFGAVLMFFFANPISGAAMPPEFLVGSWGVVGQWFPQGAGQTLIRTLSYFPEASTGHQWFVLGGWTLIGLVLLWMGSIKHKRLQHASLAADEQEAQQSAGSDDLAKPGLANV